MICTFPPRRPACTEGHYDPVDYSRHGSLIPHLSLRGTFPFCLCEARKCRSNHIPRLSLRGAPAPKQSRGESRGLPRSARNDLPFLSLRNMTVPKQSHPPPVFARHLSLLSLRGTKVPKQSHPPPVFARGASPEAISRRPILNSKQYQMTKIRSTKRFCYCAL